jgi:hypothetical protein
MMTNNNWFNELSTIYWKAFTINSIDNLSLDSRCFSWRFWFTHFKIIIKLINNFEFFAFMVYNTYTIVEKYESELKNKNSGVRKSYELKKVRLIENSLYFEMPS